MGQDQGPANGFVTKNGYIVHHVSKLDTLAGVAIKYGVEVAEIKRSNGLVTDLQMFAHKTLRIPVGRRHTFAPAFVKTEGSRRHAFAPDFVNAEGSSLYGEESPSLNIQLESAEENDMRCREKRPLSSAMNLLRGYYGLSSPSQQAGRSHAAGMEMTSSPYKPVDVEEEHLDDEGPFSPVSMPLIMVLNSGLLEPNGVHNWQNCQESSLPITSYNETRQAELSPAPGESNSNERAVRRRFKADVESTCDGGNEVDNGSTLDRVLPIAGHLRAPDNTGGLPVALLKVFDAALVGTKGKESPVLNVKKSPSTSSVQDQSLAQANVGVQRFGPLAQGGPRTLFDTTPAKPLNHHRYKAALD